MLLTIPDDFGVSQVQMIKKRQFFQNVQNNPLLCLIIGVIGGFLIGRINQYLVARQNLWCVSSLEADVLRVRDNDNYGDNFPSTAAGTTDENLVIIGVMTAKKYLQSRVVAVRDTWAKDSKLRVIFFTSEGSELYAPDGVEVVGLAGVDDSYPPQKKSFLMLKYMHDHYRDRYRFFLRADDDVYIKTDKLAPFLHSIDTSNNRPLFIGQAGLGNKNEFGMLDLGPDENFCMGGPTMVLSRETVVRVVPHIADCLKNLYTTHEDVEVGRCVSRYANVSCTWSYEMQKIFFNNYNEPQGSFTHSLREPSVQRAITLHPFKNISYMYRAYHHFLSRRVTGIRNKKVEMSRRINQMNIELKDRDDYYSPDKFGLEPSLMKFVPRDGDEVVSWDFFSKHVYSDMHSNPRRMFETDLQGAVEDIILQIMDDTNDDSHRKSRVMDFKELLYGYRRVVSPYSADYILDMLLTYKKFKSKQKMPVLVRRHVYVQQSFLHPETMFDPRLERQSLNEEFKLNQVGEDIENRGNIFVGGSYNWMQPATIPDLLSKRVNVILPLAGRHKVFLNFMRNFEEVCLKTDENVSLHVVLFKGDPRDGGHLDTTSFLEVMALKYPGRLLTYQILEGPFSRGVALQNGAGRYQSDDLLFFIDVDIAMKRDVLLRIRLNTIYKHQVYYPTVFSQYNPRYTCSVDPEHKGQTRTFHANIDKEAIEPLTWKTNHPDSHQGDLNDVNVHKYNNPFNNNSTSTSLAQHAKVNLLPETESTAQDESDSTAEETSQKFESLFSSIIGDCESELEHDGTFDLRPHAGYWREFGFGIAAMYKKDFDTVGGFDLDIKGWGKEDVDLVERFISSGYSVLRSVDPGLVHVYHSIICNPQLNLAQHQMCLGSKASSYASIDTLAKIILAVPEIIKKNDSTSKPKLYTVV